ncbi:MAG: D-alanyl-D-alanine carboxypeptidase, partial [Clostridia bacterium]|nr:D-alanyl-D-alanine carboxypeptidase [Clostridia bacterium]
FIFCFLLMPVSNTKCYAEEKQNLCQNCKSALLYDDKSKTVIFAKDEHKRLPIASMTKLATLMLVFEAIDEGKLSEDQMIKVSQNAADTEGSSAFLDAKSEYKIGDLIMTVIVASANDSAVALAEAVSGSEVAFAKEMNARAEQLGLSDTNFINATGLPAVDHYSSAHDISIIYSQICDHPIYKKYSKIWMTELVHPSGRKTDIVNTNRLIRSYDGCDGGKTGYTKEAQYCLTASATRGDMRLIGVVIGAQTSKERFNQMSDLFNFGFDNFENKVIISSKSPLQNVEVIGSKTKNVDVYASEDFVKFLKRGEEFDYSLKYEINSIKAPLQAGEIIGKLYVLDENNIVISEHDLIVHDEITAITFGEIFHKIIENI